MCVFIVLINEYYSRLQTVRDTGNWEDWLKFFLNREQVRDIVQISYQNANNLVKDLCNVGLLEEITGQKRNRAFAYAPYLNVFRDS